MEELQSEANQEALQNLIASIGRSSSGQHHGHDDQNPEVDQLRQQQTLHLAQRILSSSIGTSGSAGGDNLSGSNTKRRTRSSSYLLKKVERAYRRKCVTGADGNADGDGDGDGDGDAEENIRTQMEHIEELYDGIYRKEGEGLAGDLMLLFARLAGTGNKNDNGNNGGASVAVAGMGDGNYYPSSATATSAATATDAPIIEEVPPVNNPLRSHKHLAMALHNEEMNILRECIHSLQNIDGDVIRFHRNRNSGKGKGMGKGYSKNNGTSIDRATSTSPKSIQDEFNDKSHSIMESYEGVRIRPNLFPISILHHDPISMAEHSQNRLLRSGALDALRICGEAGWLYGRIQCYIEGIHSDASGDGGGVVPRALASALIKEMQSYHALLVSIEKQLYATDGTGTQLTLRRLLAQLRGPMSQLRTLALIVDGCQSQSIHNHNQDDDNNRNADTDKVKGGQLLTVLYLHSMHGDVRHQNVSNRILYQASLPWYDLLYDWTMAGKLTQGSGSSFMNNNREFFIEEDTSVTNANLWQWRYLINETQIPHIPGIGSGSGNGGGVRGGGLLSEQMAKEILIVGKGINFIRKCLHDSEWELDLRDMLQSKGRNGNGSSSDIDMEDVIVTMRDGYHPDDNIMRQMKIKLGFHYNADDDGYGHGHGHGHSQSSLDICGKHGQVRTKTSMERTVAIASSQVHKHILSSLFEQHHLMEHLHGLKEIMFLGQGAFISSLMDGLHAEFESRHSLEEIHMISLLNIFLASVGSTNAKFLPKFVTDRVQVRLLPIDDTVDSFWITGDDEHGDGSNSSSDDADLAKDGWDIFSLGYAADAPLTAVVHPEAMEKYHLVFNLLFRLKRIEWMMNNTWRQSTVLNHTLQILISKYGTVELAPSTSTKRENALTRTKRLLRKFSMTRQSMLHFITNLQSYFMFEVLESGWKTLVDKLSSAKSLDEVIASHNEYLDEIVAKSLLGESSFGNSNVKSNSGEKQKHRKTEKGGEIYKIERQLRRVLTTTFRFCKIHERIFSKALDTIEKAGEKRRGAERKSMAGKWGFENFDPDVEGSNFFNLAGEGRLEEVEAVSEEFDLCLRNLLSMLTDRINGTAVKDVDVNVSISSPSPLRAPVPVEADRMRASNNDSLRFLTFRLDFSGFYGQ